MVSQMTSPKGLSTDALGRMEVTHNPPRLQVRSRALDNVFDSLYILPCTQSYVDLTSW